MTRHNGDPGIGSREGVLRTDIPRSTAGNFLEPESLIDPDCTRVVLPDVQPNRRGIFRHAPEAWPAL